MSAIDGSGYRSNAPDKFTFRFNHSSPNVMIWTRIRRRVQVRRVTHPAYTDHWGYECGICAPGKTRGAIDGAPWRWSDAYAAAIWHYRDLHKESA